MLHIQYLIQQPAPSTINNNYLLLIFYLLFTCYYSLRSSGRVKLLFIINCAICWIKYCTINTLHGIWITFIFLNFTHMLGKH
jgi:predicted membrane protein